MFLQQDGTPSHYAFRAKDYLNQFLPENFCGTVYLLTGHPILTSHPQTVDELEYRM